MLSRFTDLYLKLSWRLISKYIFQVQKTPYSSSYNLLLMFSLFWLKKVHFLKDQMSLFKNSTFSCRRCNLKKLKFRIHIALKKYEKTPPKFKIILSFYSTWDIWFWLVLKKKSLFSLENLRSEEDMKIFLYKVSSRQLQAAHGVSLEYWNTQKSLCSLWKCFSCLLYEGTAKICKNKLNF